jgi:hypothetical protein
MNSNALCSNEVIMNGASNTKGLNALWKHSRLEIVRTTPYESVATQISLYSKIPRFSPDCKQKLELAEIM